LAEILIETHTPMEENTPTESAMSAGQDYHDPSGDGILADMARVFDEVAPPEEERMPEERMPETTEQEAPIADEKPLIEESFFNDDEPEPVKEAVKPGEFDEEAFNRETEESVKGMEGKAGEKFKALRSELKEARQTSVTPEIKEKFEKLELKAQEAEGLRARLDELSNQSAKLKVENSDEYQQSVVLPASEVFRRSDDLAALYETEPAILRAIIKETDRRKQNALISEHLDGFSDFDRNEVYRMTQDFAGLVAKRGAMLDNAETQLSQIQARQVEQTQKVLGEQRAAVQTLQKDIWKKYRDVIPGFTDDGGNDSADYTKLMQKSLSIDFSRAKGTDQAFAAFAGMALPHVVKQVSMLQKKLSAYESQDSSRAAAMPRPGASIAGSAASDDEPEDLMSHLRKQRFS
jgi:hypothetical protein